MVQYFVALFQLSEWLVIWLYESTSFVFEWDEGNLEKSENKHGVRAEEVEEVFNIKSMLALGKQVRPKIAEERFGIIGPTKEGRMLCVVFTIRNNKVRPISTRVANKKERRLYAKNICKIPKGI